MPVRLLHLADLHLDSAYGGREATRARLRTATMEALRAAARYAVDERLDAVLIAGDAFDDDRLGYEARAALRGEVARLVRAGIDVVYVTGNHDPGARGQRAAGLGLDRSGGPGARRHGGQLVVALDGTPVAATLSKNGRPYLHVAAAGHVNAAVTDDLAARLVRPPRGDGLPAVAVLHTQVASARGADGHAPYAPSSPATLRDAGFDYWALGHVHVRGRAAMEAPAWYAGNLVGRNAKESGPKGGLLVELDGDGLVHEPELVPFAPVEHRTLDLEGGPIGDPESVARDAASTLEALRGEGSGLAPALVLRLEGSVCTDDFARELEAIETRVSAEDAVRDELTAALGGTEILEVQLRLTRADISDPLDLAGPSALAEALDLAEEIAHTGALPPGLADHLDLARSRGAEELASMAATARAELERRAAARARPPSR